MSRIHDALKKAEQERAALGQPGAPAPPPPPLAAPEAEAALAQMGVASAAPAPAMPVVAAAAPPAGVVSLEQLKARAQAKWSPDPLTMLFFQKDDHAVGAEEFRTLRSRLYQVRQKQALQTVLVSSALPGEGKSFVSANLAQVIVRQHGRSALLIDADLRWSRLHQYLGTPPTPGLSEYLRGEVDELAVIQRGPLENLYFIPGGKQVSNPAELINNGRLKALLHRMAEVFDWVVVDSPPAVPVTDASMMADMCDGVLMVVEANTTPLDMAQKARQEFSSKLLLGVVLNRVATKATYTGYYYYGDYKKAQEQAQSK